MADDNPTPNLDTPWLEAQPGRKNNPAGISRIWWRWLIAEFEAIYGALYPDPPGAGEVVTPGASPYEYTATAGGHLLISGGTVTGVTLERDGAVFATGITAGFIPVGIGDIVEVTYAVAPTLTFLP